MKKRINLNSQKNKKIDSAYIFAFIKINLELFIFVNIIFYLYNSIINLKLYI